MLISSRCALTLVVVIVCGGCAQRHPITVETVEPWQKTYEEMSVQAVPSPAPTPVSGRALEEEDPSSRLPQPMAFLSDALAFPFRGLGWLVQRVL